MTLAETLHFMNTHPWIFYYMDPMPKQAKSGTDFGLMNGGFSEERVTEYRTRQQRIDKIQNNEPYINIQEPPSGWIGPNEYDYEKLDYFLKELLDGFPQRYLVPRVHFDAPVEWCREHPEELCVYWNGPDTAEGIRALVGTEQHDLRGWDGSNKPYPNELIARQSFSSPVWLADASEALRRFVEHIEASPYADQVIGYMPMMGNCGENMWWGDWRNQGDPRRGDFGIHHRQLFYDWAVEKYGSAQALREAWNMPGLTRENLPMPTPPERWSETGMDLKQVLLVNDQRQTDCNEFHSKVTMDALEAFGKLIKEMTGKATGTFYGYFQDQNVGYAGHLAIERALHTPYLDFYSSPKGYHYCLAGDPGAAQAPSQSFVRKKLWIEENDSRSYLSNDVIRKPDTFEETRTIFWRELYRALTFNHGFWWMDIGGLGDDWYGDDKMVGLLTELAPFFKKWSKIPRKGVAEVLFIEDEASCMHQADCAGMQRSLRLKLERELRLAGAPVDHYRMHDLLEMDLSSYKVIVFVHAFVMPEALWKQIQARIRPDATVLWNWAAALQTPDYDPNNQERVAGFRIKETKGRMQPEELYRHMYWHCMHHMPQDYPLLAIEPAPGQTVIQTSPDRHILCAQVDRGQGGKSIYAADFTLRTSLLRRFMDEADVKPWAPKHCAVLADEALVGFFPRYDVDFDFVFQGLWRDAVTGEEVSGAQNLRIHAKDFRVFEKVR